jgi:NADH-quinone oxidoreductase subunit J
MMPLWLFAFLAALAVFSALGVVLQQNPVHCLLSLALTLVDMGVLFIGLRAETVGFLQTIIYVGAIMVLFLFVIWLLNLQADAPSTGRLAFKFLCMIGAAAIAAELFLFFFGVGVTAPRIATPVEYGSIESLAHLLFTDYLIAFEVTSLLLLAAIAGAIGLARRTILSPSQAVQNSRLEQ